MDGSVASRLGPREVAMGKGVGLGGSSPTPDWVDATSAGVTGVADGAAGGWVAGAEAQAARKMATRMKVGRKRVFIIESFSQF